MWLTWPSPSRSRQRICTRWPLLVAHAASSRPQRSTQRRRSGAHEVERVGAAVGRVAAADQHPRRRRHAVGGQRRGREAGRHREEEDGARRRRSSRIAVGSQPVALTTTTVRSAGGDPGGAHRLERARAGRAGRRMTPTSQRPSARDALRPPRRRRRPRRASRPPSRRARAASASLPAWPAPSTQTVPPSGSELADVRAGGADVVDLERHLERKVVRAPAPSRSARRRRRCPRPRPAASRRVEAR